MKVNKFLFPLIVLAVFFLVIGGAMALGLWQTKGGQGRGGGRDGGRGGHCDSSAPAIETVAPVSAVSLFVEVV